MNKKMMIRVLLAVISIALLIVLIFSFKYRLYQYNPGDSIEITYFRGVEEHTTRITLITTS